MPDSESPSRPASLHALLQGLGALLLTRAELARIEWQEQQERLLLQMLLLGVGIVLLLAALIAGLLFIALMTAPEWRVTVMGVLTLLLAASGLGVLLWTQARAARAPRAFALTLQEVRKDCQALSGRDET